MRKGAAALILFEFLSNVTSFSSFPLVCSEPDFVRLVGGSSRCAGELEVKQHGVWRKVDNAVGQWNLKTADVVCRELGCGAPSVLQGALYGEVEAPMWTKEFQCGGHESALLDCRTSGSDRNTCSPGEAVGLTCSGRRGPNDIRLVGGSSSCVGRLEMKHKGKWKQLSHPLPYLWDMMSAVVVCRQLDCGPVLTTETIHVDKTDTWMIIPSCGQSESAIRECASAWPSSSQDILKITCSVAAWGTYFGTLYVCSSIYIKVRLNTVRINNNSVRLVNGNSLCSGRLEVKSNQRWSSVCEDDFDQQDAEVVCRELGCGAPSVLQGALYGEVEAPMWTKEFQCGGHESALLDCRTSGSDRNTCSPGKAVGLTCSGRRGAALVGGSSRCAGELEVKQHGVWRKVDNAVGWWNLKTADAVCRQLDCGSVVSTEKIQSLTSVPVWKINSTCLQSGSAVSDCVSSTTDFANYHLEVKCSGNTSKHISCDVLLFTFLHSAYMHREGRGRLEVKSNQRWSSVCEDDFDLQDAEVVCRELGCGAPSVLQGALYGEVEAPMWTKEFQCGGHESALLDCRTSGSDRNTCSPGEAVGLTCSEPNDIRLVGGSSSCVGRFEMKYKGKWKQVSHPLLSVRDMMSVAVVCRQLDCGPVLTTETIHVDNTDTWMIIPFCGQSESAFREFTFLTDGLRTETGLTKMTKSPLVNGNSLCSGRLEVKSNQRWSSVCEDDFDQQDAEVVCRELGCGAPSVLQGALYGEVEAPMWTKEFQCGGHESALLDCRTSGSDRNTCSPGKAVGLTCSGRKGAAALILFDFLLNVTSFSSFPLVCSEASFVRLVGRSSRCAGELEVKQQGMWRKVIDEKSQWNLKTADAVCRQLDCGSAVSTEKIQSLTYGPVWEIRSTCLQSGSPVSDCVSTTTDTNNFHLEVKCSGNTSKHISCGGCLVYIFSFHRSKPHYIK
uniref:SRCR domain-containing protein n=1 Tax=Sparus aurata TaxID=8175 RepID=A0A671TRR5_SPAAU